MASEFNQFFKLQDLGMECFSLNAKYNEELTISIQYQNSQYSRPEAYISLSSEKVEMDVAVVPEEPKKDELDKLPSQKNSFFVCCKKNDNQQALFYVNKKDRLKKKK